MQLTALTISVNRLLLVQSLDVISVNIWHILISLANLFLLFLILKKFLYKPVKKMLKERQDAIDNQYKQAQDALDQAEGKEKEWEEKMLSAKAEADAIINKATEQADVKGQKIIAEAMEKADGIVARAQTQAELETKKARAKIKNDIVTVSTALTEKILEREINAKDHDALIDSVIEEMGDLDEKRI